MNNGLRKAAAAAALVTGLVAGSTVTASAAPRSERITSQEQLAASIAKAVAAEQDSGTVAGGPVIAGMVTASNSASPLRAPC
ncbi:MULTISPECIES: hypothetical protein [unclassified Streptomyces]|uniref:hypothetical protein n=1 Tax=unclassified Streptomyces TaxID=2593676 RepID=UPI0033B957D2